MEKVKINWDEVESVCSRIVMKIGQSNEWPNTIVAVANGGSIPAVTIANMMGIKNIVYVTATHYGNDETRLPSVSIKSPSVLWTFEPSETVLVVDDIYDTGDTIKAITKQIFASNSNSSPKIITATVFLRENAPDAFKHLTHYGKIAKAGVWLDFPWEKSS